MLKSRRRFEAKPWRRLYSTKAWQSLRAERLQANPLCQFCLKAGRLTPAEVVDHIRPHRGNETKFYDYSNTQSLCKRCHDGAKQRQERSGQTPGCNEDGFPNDKGHHWR